MLEEITTRQLKLGLLTRKLAQQLDVSPTLLSLVLNKKRQASNDLTGRIRRWMNTPIADGCQRPQVQGEHSVGLTVF